MKYLRFSAEPEKKDTCKMNKRELRDRYKKIRREVTDRAEKERAIADKLLSVIKDAETVFCYESITGEVSTKDIISRLSEFAEVFVPIVKKEDMLLYSRVSDRYTDTCDYTVVPLIAFDEELDRIGFGGGYYDRFLASHKTISVGIAFDEQQCEKFETEKTDMRPDMIITPTRILRS